MILNKLEINLQRTKYAKSNVSPSIPYFRKIHLEINKMHEISNGELHETISVGRFVKIVYKIGVEDRLYHSCDE